MSAKITVADLCAGYNGTQILSNVRLELEASEFAGVIGPNGSGKTTLLRCISRALAPVSGFVKLDDQIIYSISARDFARRVAVVPQDTLVAFDFTVLEIALMGRSPRLGRFAVETARDVSIAMESLSRTRTDHLKDRSINALSGGERQRVMIARALAQEPEVLLLDEPTSHLDISFQYEIMDLLRELNRERGLSVLAVLHDLNLAGHYCDRLFLLGDGEIRACGPPEEVITAENIRRAYGAEVWVRRHPASHRPYVIAGVSRGAGELSDKFDTAPRVHVIGGGGTAAPVLATLVRRGYEVTCGVLSAGDADHEVAEALGIPHVLQSPFSRITAESDVKHRQLIGSADVIVLTDVPIGSGNLLNAQAARDAARAGRNVIVVRPEIVRERDFTGGDGAQAIEQAVSSGARPAGDLAEVTRLIEEMLDRQQSSDRQPLTDGEAGGS